MTRNEKKTAIENMAERFMNISDLEGKSMAIMVMRSKCSTLKNGGATVGIESTVC